MAFSSNSLYNHLTTIVKDRWNKTYNEELTNTDPLDSDMYIANHLVETGMAIIISISHFE